MAKKSKSAKQHSSAANRGADALLDALLAATPASTTCDATVAAASNGANSEAAYTTASGSEFKTTALGWDKATPVALQFKGSSFPLGAVCDYRDDNLMRTTSEEVRAADRAMHADIEDARRAAEVHRQVRQRVRAVMRPGMSMVDLCEMVENGTRALVGSDSLAAGIAFPTGCSLNHCAAHWTPNPGDTTVLQYSDVCKVDFGVQVNGRIIDSAFTVAFDPRYDALLDAVRAATNAGIKEAGIDVRMGDIGTAIQEVMESHEIELDGRTHVVRSIRNLTGHSIERYKIHAGKSVPIVRNASDSNVKMEEGEYYAIETFGSTGRGYVVNGDDCSHYMRSFEPPSAASVRLPRARQLLSTISREFGSLAFCKRYLDRIGETKLTIPLRSLVEAGVIDQYPPLVDARGCYTAQWEHTLVLRPTCKEVLSRGDDY